MDRFGVFEGSPRSKTAAVEIGLDSRVHGYISEATQRWHNMNEDWWRVLTDHAFIRLILYKTLSGVQLEEDLGARWQVKRVI